MKWLVILALFWASVAWAQCTPGTVSVVAVGSDLGYCQVQYPPNGSCDPGNPPANNPGTWQPPFQLCDQASAGVSYQFNSDHEVNHGCSPSSTNCGYQYEIGFMRWTLAALPVGAQWDSASVTFELTANDCGSGPDVLVEKYHDWGAGPPTFADFTFAPSASAANWGAVRNFPFFPGPFGPVSLPINGSVIPTTGGVFALRMGINGSAAPVFATSAQFGLESGAVLDASYVCATATSTPTITPTSPPATATQITIETATAAPTVTQIAQETQTAGPPATQTQAFHDTQTAAPSATPTATITPTGTAPTATATATPNVNQGCCLCTNTVCSEAPVSGCPDHCVFGGVGSVCGMAP